MRGDKLKNIESLLGEQLYLGIKDMAKEDLIISKVLDSNNSEELVKRLAAALICVAEQRNKISLLTVKHLDQNLCREDTT